MRSYIVDSMNKGFVAVTLDGVEISRTQIGSATPGYVPIVVSGIKASSTNPMLKIRFIDARTGPTGVVSDVRILIDTVSLVKEQIDPVQQVVSCVSQTPVVTSVGQLPDRR
jgi:hypothetical protein